MRAFDADVIESLDPATSCLVQAGPGTGKTRLIARRIQYLLARGTRPGAGIACITYTNAAAEEISHRIASSGKPAFLGTIHSFLLENLVYPYGHWIEGVPASFDLVTEGFAAPHLQWMAANGLIDNRKTHIPDVRDAFEAIGYNIQGNPKCFANAGLRTAEMQAFIGRRMATGQLSQHDVLWIALKILTDERYPQVCEALSCRFSAILVDEFQDATELQYAILKRIHSKERTALFLVGDPEQSIFSFAGASLETYEDAHRQFTTFSLDKNYRATGVIVDFLNLFVPLEMKLHAVGPAKDQIIPVHVLVSGGDDRAAIDFFMQLRREYGLEGKDGRIDYLLLARDTKHVRMLENLVPAENVEAEDFFEKLRANHPLLLSVIKDLLRARKLAGLNAYSAAFDSLDRGLSRLILKCNPGFGAPETIGLVRNSWRSVLCQVLRVMIAMEEGEIRDWVEGLSEIVQQSILQNGGVKTGRKMILLQKLRENLPKKSMYRATSCIQAIDVSDEVRSHVRTIHRAKGLEAEAVIVFAARAAQVTEWLNPAESGKARTENARMGYVAFSRAGRLLCVSTPAMSVATETLLRSLENVKLIVVRTPTQISK